MIKSAAAPMRSPKKEPASPAKDPRAPLDNEACANAQVNNPPDGEEKQSWLDRPVLGGDSIASGQCNAVIPLRKVCEDTRNGRWKDVTGEIQQAIKDGETERADHLKKQLSFVCTSVSEAKGNRRRADDVTRHSGVISSDFDKVGDLEGTKALLAKDPLVAVVMVSPSGRGLNVWWRIQIPSDPRTHLEAFHAIAHYCEVTYGLVADPSCKDVFRARFVTHDPEIFVNEDAPIFPVGEWYQRCQEANHVNLQPKSQDLDWLDRELGIIVQSLRFDGFLKEAGLLIRIQVDETEEGKRTKYIIRCPRKAGHSTGTDGDTSTVLMVYPNGYVQFDCKHAACQKWGLPQFLRWAKDEFPGILLRHAAEYQSVQHPFTDYGNSLRVVDHAQGRFGYDPLTKTMAVFDGSVWRLHSHPDDSPGYQLTVEAHLEIPFEAVDIPDPQGRMATRDWATRSQSDAKIKAALKLALRNKNLIISRTDFDRDPYLLNCPNGTVDLRTGELQPHRREDYCSQMTVVPFHPDADAPRWRAFLHEVMEGDEELISFLHRLLGSWLSGIRKDQVFSYFQGAGANGKSVVQRVMSMMLGNYAVAMDMNVLARKPPSKGAHPELYVLIGKRLAIAVEPEEGTYLSESTMKQLTGGDLIAVRPMYSGGYVEFVSNAAICIASNHQLRIRGTDDGIWRRACFIPFRVQIPEEKQIANLAEKMIEEEGPGILAWAVRGCQEYLKTGLNIPKSLKQVKAERRQDQDILGAFLCERCELDAEATVAKVELYHAYRDWSDEGRERTLTRSVFFEKIQERGFNDCRIGGTRSKRGLRLVAGVARSVVSLDGNRLKGGDL